MSALPSTRTIFCGEGMAVELRRHARAGREGRSRGKVDLIGDPTHVGRTRVATRYAMPCDRGPTLATWVCLLGEGWRPEPPPLEARASIRAESPGGARVSARRKRRKPGL